MITYQDALDTILANAITPSVTELIPLNAALGRIVAQQQVAAINVPGYDNSAMDGYAVRVADITLDNEFIQSQRIAAGDIAKPLQAGTVARIFTGAMIPQGADAVILQEDTRLQESTCSSSAQPAAPVRFTELPKPNQHIRPAGQDISASAVIVEQGKRLTAGDIGLLASAGIAAVPCFRPLRVAFFSTGDELKNPGEDLALGQIYNSNRYFLSATLSELGAEPIDLGCCPDTPEATRALLQAASETADCIITTGGMSVGEEDHVRAQVEALGSILFWKIAIKPGKPVAFATISASATATKAYDTLFFGLPGNPVSSFVTFHLFVRPWLLKSMGCKAWQAKTVTAIARFDCHNKGRRLDFLRGISSINAKGELQVDLYSNQSSGVLSSIAASNVLVPVAPGQSLQSGDSCEVISLAAFDQLQL